MTEIRRIEIPESSRLSLRALLFQRQQVEQSIGIYIRALRDSLSVEGDGWSVDLSEMVFVQSSPNGKVDADVVGAIASDNTGK